VDAGASGSELVSGRSKASALARFVWQERLHDHRSFVSRTRFRLAEKIWAHFQNTDDPLIEYVLDGVPLLLPMSHPLPRYRREHPQYSSNVGRIAAAVSRVVPNFTFVDIGANVGDTLAIVRAQATFPVLCIEGAEAYVPLLRANAAQFDEVEIEPLFVGPKERSYALVASAGTGHLDFCDRGDVATSSLDAILARHPRFEKSAMVKLDTDGMDTTILKSEVEFLAKVQPVVFFEYDPHFFVQHDGSGFSVFEVLLQAGYGPVLVYTNVGDLLCLTDLRERELLRDLHEFYTGREGRQYCDMCAFPDHRSGLSGQIHCSELEFFRAFRAQAGGARA
jgi:FkbM family methyltransferase